MGNDWEYRWEPGVNLHSIEWDPAYEYKTTFCLGFGDWPDRDKPPAGEGWERNVDAGDDGYDLGERTQRSYWRRKVR